MDFLSIVKVFIKNLAGQYIDSAKENIHSFLKKVYVFILASLFSIVMLLFSIASLIVSIAQKLDELNFFWMNSMTLYSVIAFLSMGSLYCLKKHYSFTEKSIDEEIEEVIKKHIKKRPRRANKTKKHN